MAPIIPAPTAAKRGVRAGLLKERKRHERCAVLIKLVRSEIAGKSPAPQSLDGRCGERDAAHRATKDMFVLYKLKRGDRERGG